MRSVLYNCPYLHGPGAIRWIVAAWEEGFRRRGYELRTCQDAQLLRGMCAERRPDILYCDIVSTPLEDPDCRALLQELRAAGTKVCLNIFWPLADALHARAAALAQHDVADVYCGEREPDSMRTFGADTGRTYVTMPQAANPRLHFPEVPDPRFEYDIAFVGARLPHKRWFNEEVLGPMRRRFRVGLFGPGWTVRDNARRAASKAARIARLPGLARAIDRTRFAISDDDERRLYATAKIALNFHEREPDNSQPHHIVNQRTFKIAACGGFQIVDPVLALPNYFAADEIVTAGFDAGEWLRKVEYYLQHEDERKAIQQRATRRAVEHHMAQHRVDFLERLLGIAPATARDAV